MNRFIITLFISLCASLQMQAQNWATPRAYDNAVRLVDKLVEQYSKVKSSEFTSAVQRDPSTHKIVKTVKTLKVKGRDAVNTIMDAFRPLSQFEHGKDGRVVTSIFRAADDRARHAYVINVDDGYDSATIMVVITKIKK